MPRKPQTPALPVSPLPGELAVDDQLVQATVARLNLIYVSKGLETARLVGEALLASFFDDQLEVFEQRAPSHLSFRALAEHAQLRVSHSFLWYSVRLLPQLRALPEELATALPLSHHRLLLHVKDTQEKTELAQLAVERSLGKRELGEEIRKRRAGSESGARRGRKALPAFVKAFNTVRKAAQSIDAEQLGPSDLRDFGVDQARDYLAEVEQTLEQLARLRGQLAERVAAMAAA